MNINNLGVNQDNTILFDKIDLNLNKGDKVIVLSKDARASTAFYEAVSGNHPAANGTVNWGITTSQSYLPLDNSSFFEKPLSLVDWLRQYAQTEEA
ncbi:MAG: hypothetical protein CM15mP59_6080 [Flavobacteriaceae bacterium]|nr:MAG: hypothetical protein CM15mP59_6080 [Flavobacteriaceae bacterium]